MGTEKANHTLEGKLSTMEKHLHQINQRIIHYFDSPCTCNEDPDVPTVHRLEDNVQRLILRASALERELSISRTLAGDDRRKLFAVMRVEDTGQELRRAYQESLEVVEDALKRLCLETSKARLLFNLDRGERPVSNSPINASLTIGTQGDIQDEGHIESHTVNRHSGSVDVEIGRSWEASVRLVHGNISAICDNIDVTKDAISDLQYKIEQLEDEIDRMRVRQSAFDALLTPLTSPRVSTFNSKHSAHTSAKVKPLPPVKSRAAPARKVVHTPPSQPVNSPVPDPIIRTSELLVSQSAERLQYHKLKGRQQQRKRKSPRGKPQHFTLPELLAQAEDRKLGYPGNLSLRQMELLAKQIGVAVKVQKPQSEYFSDK